MFCRGVQFVLKPTVASRNGDLNARDLNPWRNQREFSPFSVNKFQKKGGELKELFFSRFYSF
jgi:hypothetical protein